MARLIVKSGDNIGKEYNLLDVTTAGRLAANPIYIDDTLASREHCKVIKEADGYYIIDLGSHNGTRVNGEKITRKKLISGDIVRIGHVDLGFETDDVAPSVKTIETNQDKSGSINQERPDKETLPRSKPEAITSRILFFVLTLCCLVILIFLSRSVGYSWAKRMLAPSRFAAGAGPE